ncbi:MAG: T9SS type A sorting domain-containing protein [Aureispira sp.]|nr:T9SS type A sorting domain-containing protein [Aureispira sp.]
MNTKAILLFILCFSTVLHAQHQHPANVRCLYDHGVEQMEAKYPGFIKAANAAFEDAKQRGNNSAQLRNSYTIPVAFHVVWNTAAEKISECKVLEQIEILNEDYRRLNPDTANLRPFFNSIVGNPQITFRLDTIIWKQTATTTFDPGFPPSTATSDMVKQTSNGGSDALDTKQYLNIWACNMGTGGTLGFAYPPVGMANWPAGSYSTDSTLQGVVLDYKIVNRSAVYTVTSPFGPPSTINTQGRTAVHEVGHYLGMRHIWGDGPFANFGIADCTVDDGIMDTPNSGLPSQFTCDTTQNTCFAGTPGDSVDMIENYMDYSEESCMNAFTKGQVALMHGVLVSGGLRADLATTPDPNRPYNDGMLYPQSLVASSTPTCLSQQAGSTANARPSMDPCTGTVARDVWYSFTAVNDSLVVELSNITNTQGSGMVLVHEVLENACTTPNSLSCSTQNTDTLIGLTPGNTYMIRVYSLDSASSQNFDICVRNVSTSVIITNTKSVEKATPTIAIAPNPTTGLFTINVEGAITEGFVQVRNLLGQPISNQLNLAGEQSSVQVDLSKQSSGVYILEFHINGRQSIKKVVLNK